MRIALIGVVAGFFSALFGVGGGIVTVPLLVVVAGFAMRPATATSLAAIGLTALAGASVYAALGHVDVAAAALVGIPGAVGATAGAVVQQRIGRRALPLAFSALLLAIAVWLLVG